MKTHEPLLKKQLFIEPYSRRVCKKQLFLYICLWMSKIDGSRCGVRTSEDWSFSNLGPFLISTVKAAIIEKHPSRADSKRVPPYKWKRKDIQKYERGFNRCWWDTILLVNVTTLLVWNWFHSGKWLTHIHISPESLIDGGCLSFIRYETKCGEGAGQATLLRQSIELQGDRRASLMALAASGFSSGASGLRSTLLPLQEPLLCCWEKQETYMTLQYFAKECQGQELMWPILQVDNLIWPI